MTPADLAVVVRRLDQQDEVLGEIRTHVKETNGRVRKLELWQAGVEGGRRALAWLPTLAIGCVVGVLGAIAASAIH